MANPFVGGIQEFQAFIRTREALKKLDAPTLDDAIKIQVAERERVGLIPPITTKVIPDLQRNFALIAVGIGAVVYLVLRKR